MKAAVHHKYGAPEVIEIVDMERPEPKAGEVLVKIHAATVSSGDARLRAFDIPKPYRLIGRLIFGITKPRKPVLGYDFAGTVAALGAGVTRFKVGDAVFGSHGFGSHAEYKCVPEKRRSPTCQRGCGLKKRRRSRLAD
ncbi:alcohol dehydrogenase catalytic domain-containing protein [Devosia algicola]|uniref:Alcohol dehydrogenase catalytic domain-containing protein n=1 Tax=Devosia algicola TaxID=3026418 RepID=A0ABY7YM86_9HYPH|nr:alcohol dehydrogenase catalytic domain-containing protein [Devosia algicola]WDR02055.1 alcohol dehydrogenase catalytic domain-containing protein [Devosia algicola]